MINDDWFQYKDKYLKHYDQCTSGGCESDKEVEKYREQQKCLREVLEPALAPSVEAAAGAGSSTGSKVLYGSDIVKQLLASKLSKHVDTHTLAELTI